MASERISRRLALLEDFRLTPADLEFIVAELEDYDRALRELQAFAEGSSWLALPVQPTIPKEKHDQD